MPKPKFLLDADMPRSSADVIRNLGFDVEDVRDLGMRYAQDKEIMDYALETGRIVITMDLDFGEILRYPKHPGAIILRLPSGFTIDKINRVLEDFLSSQDIGILKESIIIVELGRYRRRPIKNARDG
jgi:predicted nuclease of predicted toxin-antitoxin system